MKAVLISTLTCALIAAVVFLLDLCADCIILKLVATGLIILWIALYTLLSRKNQRA